MRSEKRCDLCRAGTPRGSGAGNGRAMARGGHREPPRYAGRIGRELARIFGGEPWFVSERKQTGPVPIDVCVVPPRDARDYSVLVTAGLSDLPMRAPEETGMDLAWAELALALPGSWRLDRESLRAERWWWPLGLLRLAASYVHAQDAWLWYHHGMDCVNRFDPRLGFSAAFFDGAFELPVELLSIPVAPGKEVNVISVIPLFPSEFRFYASQGGDELCRRLKDAGVSEVLDPRRGPVA